MTNRFIECRFVELHDALFFAGTNFMKKLDPKRYLGLKLKYDREQKELIIEWKGRIGAIPSVALYEPENPADILEGFKKPIIQDPVQVHHAQDVVKFQGAQVETPMGHVFEGPGKGKGRGKPAKIQGEA